VQFQPQQPNDPTRAVGDPGRSGTEGAHRYALEDRLSLLRRRLIRQATLATGMLEAALEALRTYDTALVQEVLRRDDRIDEEEVQLEEECFELLALQKPFARDFRVITFILKVNGDVERVADHACSVSKLAKKLAASPPSERPEWPTALKEMAERVPMLCHSLLRAVVAEDIEKARELFAECAKLIEQRPSMAEQGLRLARVGRELERVGDLMANIAEDVVYLATGAIIRHEKHNKAPKRA